MRDCIAILGGICALAALGCSQKPKQDAYIPPAIVNMGTAEKDFSKAPIELCGLEGFSNWQGQYRINNIWEPFVVREVKGTLVNVYDRLLLWSDGYIPLIEIRGQDKRSEIRGVLTDEAGHFLIKDVPPGKYCFKTTCTAYQAYIGIIIVDRRADPKNVITIEMKPD